MWLPDISEVTKIDQNLKNSIENAETYGKPI